MAKINMEMVNTTTQRFNDLARNEERHTDKWETYALLGQKTFSNYDTWVGMFVERTMTRLYKKAMYKAERKALGLGYSSIELRANYEDIQSLAYIRSMEYLQALEDTQESVYLYDAVKPTNTTFKMDDEDITIFGLLPPVYVYFGLINVCFGAINHHLRSKRTCTLLNTYAHKENVALDALNSSDDDNALQGLLYSIENKALSHGFTDTSEFIEYMRGALTPKQYHAVTKAVASDSDTSRSQLARARKKLATDEYFSTMTYEDKLQVCHDLLQSGNGLSKLMHIQEAVSTM